MTHSDRIADDEVGGLSFALDQLNVGFAFYDADDRLRAWNRAYERVNVKIAPMIRAGAYFPDLLAELVVRGQIDGIGDDPTGWVAERLRMRETGAIAERRLCDGRRFMVRESRTEAGGIIGLWFDITDYNTPTRPGTLGPAIVDDIASPHAQDICGGVAHVFNNLLQVIRGNADLARLSTDTGELETCLADIDEAITQGNGVTDRLLAFSRQMYLRPVCCDVNPIVAKALYDVRGVVPPDVYVETALSPDIWNVEADPDLLHRVCTEAIANAIAALDGRGRVRLLSSNVKLTDKDDGLNIAGTPPGRYVLLSISDTGAGMTHDVLAQSFRPFFTTSSNKRSAGLGLPMIEGFAKQSGGAVTLSTAPGAGCELRLLLPAAEEGLSEPKAA
ncbi:MAG: ATP-binding protein [Pseudomonadota bacterium]